MLVSVVTPVYNLAKTLPQAINSLTGQSYKHLEIIIIDDGSPDNAGEVADRLARGDDRIRVIHQGNKGLQASLNRGFGEAKGESFLILSPDDMLHQSAIGAMVARMELVGADVVNTDMLVGGRPVETRALSLNMLMQANCHGYAALFKRWVFRATGGFKEAMNPSWEDREFWLNAAKLGAKGARIARPLFIYHMDLKGKGRNATAQGKDRLLMGKMMGYHQDLFGKGQGFVTFIIPLYDHEAYVREAAESALTQIYPHVKVIVVDDGSPGDPVAALEGLPVFLLRQENRGLSGARNAGIQAAISEFGSQYAVCLDADDAVDPNFIEQTMGAMKDNEYIYTDLSFIGDAWHDYEVNDFECKELYKRHLHACTFLFQTRMWQEVASYRGYGYDEAMRQGYEDWEYALACVGVGWCGFRLKEKLFRYRWHKNGSMRTEAKKIANQLGAYIRGKHSKEKIMSCCPGRGRHTRSAPTAAVKGSVMGEGIEVTYNGPKKGTMTKLGRTGRIYRFSAKKRTFYALEIDRNLFQGPYTVRGVVAEPAPTTTTPPVLKRMDTPRVPPPAPAPSPRPAAVPRAPAAPPQQPLTAEDVKQATQAVSRLLKDDIRQIRGVGPAFAGRLIKAGLTTFKSIAEMKAPELAVMLRASANRAQEVIDAAAKLAG